MKQSPPSRRRRCIRAGFVARPRRTAGPLPRLIFLAAVAVAACGGDEPLDTEALMDPARCQGCHPDHYREWSGSMHAYAAEDPVFLAMNRRGQRETKGALGDFCVRCHAPVAVALGKTRDGLNLAKLPRKLRGVTCYFCHSVVAVRGTHNNPLVMARDGVLRAGIPSPVATPVHEGTYSTLHDRNRPESSALCGACHDIVTPAGVKLERTYAEWRASLFSRPVAGGGLSCGGCHMQGRRGKVAAVPDAPVRRRHSHLFEGVDLALHAFPERKAQRAAVQGSLDSTLGAQLCVFQEKGKATWTVSVDLENVGAGHMWPSGAAQDRRAWVELRVTDAAGKVLLESGRVPAGLPVAAHAVKDRNLWRLGDRMFDARGKEVHMFWEAARVTSSLLPPPDGLPPSDPRAVQTHVVRTFTVPAGTPARATMRVRLRPMGLDVLDSLIASGDLDPSVRSAMPTFDLTSTRLEWRAGKAGRCVPGST